MVRSHAGCFRCSRSPNHSFDLEHEYRSLQTLDESGALPLARMAAGCTIYTFGRFREPARELKYQVCLTRLVVFGPSTSHP